MAAGYRTSIDGKLDGVAPEAANVAREGIAHAVMVADSAGAHQVVEAAQQAFIDGWQQAMWVGVGVMGTLFLYILAIGPKNYTDQS